MRDKDGQMYYERQKIPTYEPSFEEISEQMRINADILMQEIKDYADIQIERIKNAR